MENQLILEAMFDTCLCILVNELNSIAVKNRKISLDKGDYFQVRTTSIIPLYELSGVNYS